jgi:hypothetical protein
MTARDFRLSRSRGLATALTAATVAIGVIIALRGFRGSPAAIILGALLVVAGVLAYARSLRPWLVDEQGLSLAGNRRLLWSDVRRIQVIATTPKGAGKGMARVDLHIHTAHRKASLQLMSRKDAARVTALLQERLPANVEGRETLWLINNAWAHIE